MRTRANAPFIFLLVALAEIVLHPWPDARSLGSKTRRTEEDGNSPGFPEGRDGMSVWVGDDQTAATRRWPKIDARKASITFASRIDKDTNRTSLLYNHNPKAGGTYIRSTLSAIVPEDRLGIAKEFQSSGLAEMEMHFVIGSAREPCSHLLSLWAYGSSEHVGFFRTMKKRYGVKKVMELYGQDEQSKFSSPGDVSRFRRWVRHPAVRGILTRRLLESYSPNMSVDCFVLVEGERTPSNFRRCLEKFVSEARGGGWHDAGKVLSKFDEMDGSARARFPSSQLSNTTMKTNKSFHAGCSYYFDKETAALVEELERPLFEAFGWDHCCAPRSSREMPPS